MQNQPQQTVPLEQYNYALTNFRIAHDEVERQRRQLEEQERQVAQLRERIATLEGGGLSRQTQSSNRGGSTVDDASIRHTASKLAAHTNRWAADIVHNPPASLKDIRDAILSDLQGYAVTDPEAATSLQVQNLLRHAMSETISEGVVNCLIVTNSREANVQLTRLHEQIFSRDPLVASVWRRQTFSAAVESCTPEMSEQIIAEYLHAVTEVLSPDGKPSPTVCAILDAAYTFSRMLHASSAGGTMDAFYRAFVPELLSVMDAGQIELIKRCMNSDRGQVCHVGACVFPGLVKVTQAVKDTSHVGPTETVETVVRRAQVICQCAMSPGQAPPPTPSN